MESQNKDNEMLFRARGVITLMLSNIDKYEKGKLSLEEYNNLIKLNAEATALLLDKEIVNVQEDPSPIKVF